MSERRDQRERDAEEMQAEITRLVARVGELEGILGRVVKKYDRDRLVNKYMDKEPDSSLSVLNVPLGAVRAAAQALANGEQAR
jgi:exonuclease V gamma subunit